ncbi:hypothetical protein BATDEDRAFT_87639 [Batrachochytrium dendrobatidis JAM81]|uniref:Uncharacterized protein n=2 Tax=Batrachochytrium dendrobatidis TaxID=109871 RepID=F4P0W7_BATDJ|nr:uncharacterized protein BATDEDRAFT_87639 [Batrachochytrium dendrobatidis JAM81]EGF81661.1 hypothetical protein BATDEDRAFT_87639 [Batrachochytrium dendrobatidis JAM81]KAJ8329557.1 hypothetical protein O5D80_002129 [Batrachochytrium dendrobatidis]KAK5669455.1 hypothetical protein QVD99_003850 [Batrachochytrium dendrobatidis]OAJ37983.1 hypothetical protein BDEG_21951 [Batrachochytrium dendrobatidis JEL423]|eukprot:XP_006678281.1 hypothetical protein BATDEDRAFT_87639 [Batrachochytrium dendrobatidis JAM81]
MQSASGKTVYTNNETTHSPSSITILPSPPASANESVPLSSIPAGALQQPTIHYQQYHLPYSTHATAHSAAANTTPLQHRQSSDLAFHHISGPLSVPSSGYMPPTNSTFLIKRSVVGLKKGLISSDKYMVLCAPISIQDIQSVYELLFVSDPAKPVDARSIPWLGNVAFAAVKATPLLVILPSESRADSPVFIHFDEVRAISDEVALNSACTFVLHLARADLRFVCKTSTDYVDWIRCLTMTFEISAASFQSNADDFNRRAQILSMVQQQQYSTPNQQQHAPVNQHFGNGSGVARQDSYGQLYTANPNSNIISSSQQQYGLQVSSSGGNTPSNTGWSRQ